MTIHRTQPPTTTPPSARSVPPEGPLTAPLAIVGEAPGAREEQTGRPFVGPAGQRLDVWLRYLGMSRATVYLTNVLKTRPPDNDFASVPPERVASAVAAVQAEIAALPNLRCLVLAGNKALRAFMGYERILHWRGSPLTWRGVTTIPILHPAAILRQARWQTRTLRDFDRIRTALSGADLTPPARTCIINPLREDAAHFITQAAADPDAPLAIDIETIPGDRILCCAFSIDPSLAISIPFTTPWRRRAIAALCASPNPKILQNGLYDLFWLDRAGIPVHRYLYDTMCMHHALDPAEPHSLAYLTSIYTLQPHYKTIMPIGQRALKRFDDLQRGNCMDAMLTLEICGHLLRELDAANLLPFYRRTYTNLFPVLFAMMHEGIAVDAGGRGATFAAKRADLARQRAAISALTAGSNLFSGKKQSLSNPKLITLLYDQLGIPEHRKLGRRTADEAAIRSLLLTRWTRKKKAAEIALLEAILSFRRAEKLATFVDPKAIDADGRIRTHYNLCTEEGRLSAKRNPFGTGLNLQNQPNARGRELRDFFVPDAWCPACRQPYAQAPICPSCAGPMEPGLFLAIDLSQAESRIVYMLSGDPTLQRLANLKPIDYDAHSENAAVIFGVSASEVTKVQREIGKRVVHGIQRMMSETTLSRTLAKEGHYYSEPECHTFIRTYLRSHPGIDDYFRHIRAAIMRDRALTNSWGFTVHWPNDEMDRELYKKGASFMPQSEVAFLLNRWGLLAAHRYLTSRPGLRTRIRLQLHDELLLNTYPDECATVATAICASLERPRVLSLHGVSPVGGTLTIPCNVGVGPTWAKIASWQSLPPATELTAAAHAITSTIEHLTPEPAA